MPSSNLIFPFVGLALGPQLGLPFGLLGDEFRKLSLACDGLGREEEEGAIAEGIGESLSLSCQDQEATLLHPKAENSASREGFQPTQVLEKAQVHSQFPSPSAGITTRMGQVHPESSSPYSLIRVSFASQCLSTIFYH